MFIKHTLRVFVRMILKYEQYYKLKYQMICYCDGQQKNEWNLKCRKFCIFFLRYSNYIKRVSVLWCKIFFVTSLVLDTDMIFFFNIPTYSYT